MSDLHPANGYRNGHHDPLNAFRTGVRRILDQAEYASDPQEEMPWFPQYVLIEPTNYCNLNCVHCHHARDASGLSKYTRKKGFMEWSLYTKLIDEIAPKNVQMTLDVQGEPTLHPQFLEMVEYAKERGVFTSIITNGTRVKEPMARRLIELKLDRVVFSFDAIRKSVYEKIRIRSRFEPTLRNILRYIKLNHEAGHPTHVCMSAVYQKRNQAFADEYKAYFQKLPVDRVFLNPMLNLAGAAGTEDEIDLEAAKSESTSDQPICKVPWENITVNWDGIVSPCPVDVNVLFNAGDANEKSLEEIWNGEGYRRFRRAHLTGNYGDTADGKGHLCDKCNSLWNPEYDLRDFREHSVEAIVRDAAQHAHHLSAQNPDESSLSPEKRYQNVLEELQALELDEQAHKAAVIGED